MGASYGLTAKIVSLSVRRAWIEIQYRNLAKHPQKSLSARRAWIEISLVGFLCLFGLWSLSARRAWIEIGAGLVYV